MSGIQPRVLVIDDDRLFLEIVQFHLERSGYRVVTVADPKVGLNEAIEQQFDLILLDLMMPGMNGEEVLSLLKPLTPQRHVMVVSAHTREEYRARARDLGAAHFMSKPVDPEVLVNTVGELLKGSGIPEDDQDRKSLSLRALDSVAGWVFDEGEMSLGKRLSAMGVLAGVVLCIDMAGKVLNSSHLNRVVASGSFLLCGNQGARVVAANTRPTGIWRS